MWFLKYDSIYKKLLCFACQGHSVHDCKHAGQQLSSLKFSFNQISVFIQQTMLDLEVKHSCILLVNMFSYVWLKPE